MILEKPVILTAFGQSKLNLLDLIYMLVFNLDIYTVI
jgi:hypothetical protein